MSSKDLILSHKCIEIIENIYTSLVQNRICRLGKSFYCYLCKTQFSGIINALNHITRNDEHEDRYKIGRIDIHILSDFMINEVKSAEFVYNGIILTALPESHCVLCTCKVSSIHDIPSHINSKEHLKCISMPVTTTANNSVSTSNNISIAKSKSLTFSNKDKPNIISADNICMVPSSSNVSIGRTENLDTPNENKQLTAYYCLSCKEILKYEFAIKYHYMFHLHQANCSCQNTDIIRFYIQQKNKKLIHCIICDYETDSEEQLDKHLNEKTHQDRIDFLHQSKSIKTNKKTIEKIMNSNNKHNCFNNKVYIPKMLYCQKCDVVFDKNSSDSHFNGKPHQIKQTIEKNVEVMSNADNYTPQYKCFLCNIEFNEINLYFDHNEEIEHKLKTITINLVFRDKNIRFTFNKEKMIIKCFTCTALSYNVEIMIGHIFGSSHETKSILHKSLDIKYSCPICKISIVYYLMIQHLKSNGHKNKTIEYYNNENSKLSTKKIKFLCPICDYTFYSDTELLDHFNDPNHKNNIFKLKNENQLINSENQNSINNSIASNSNGHLNSESLNKFNKMNIGLSTFSGSTMSLNLDTSNAFSKTNTRLNKPSFSSSTFSLNLDTSNKYMCKINSGLNKPSFNNSSTRLNVDSPKNEINRGFNKVKVSETNGDGAGTLLLKKDRMPRKPIKSSSSNSMSQSKILSAHGMDYVAMCLDSDNIFNVDAEKLRKLQLGVNLTFPLDDAKRTCIACGEEFPADVLLVYEHLRGQKHVENLQEMEKYDQYFENYEDQFSDLRLAKSYMHVSPDSEELIMCFACDVEVSEAETREHVKSSEHATECQDWAKSASDIFEEIKSILTRAWYYAQKFVCELCEAKFDTELGFVEHLVQTKHLENARENGDSLEFDMCMACLTYWLGKPSAYSEHCSESSSHRYFLESRSFMAPALPTQVEDALENFASELGWQLLLADSVDDKIGADLLGSVRKIARTVFPDAEAHLCGSRLSLLGCSSDDVDLYLDCDAGYGGAKSLETIREQLLRLRQGFLEQTTDWINEDAISASAEPMLRMRHRSTNLCCNIFAANGLVVEKAKLMRCFNEAYPVCRELILFLKKWTLSCNLVESEKLSTFATSIIVIFYLQTQGILPCIKKLIDVQENKRIVAGWNVVDVKEIKIATTVLSVKDLLTDLFLYYANFDYMTNVICPFFGKPIAKSAFVDKEDPHYKYFNENEYSTQIFRFDFPMCVQDPIDLSQNVTKAISKFQLRSFIKYCSESAVILSSKTMSDAK